MKYINLVVLEELEHVSSMPTRCKSLDEHEIATLEMVHTVIINSLVSEQSSI